MSRKPPQVFTAELVTLPQQLAHPRSQRLINHPQPDTTAHVSFGGRTNEQPRSCTRRKLAVPEQRHELVTHAEAWMMPKGAEEEGQPTTAVAAWHYGKGTSVRAQERRVAATGDSGPGTNPR